MLAASEPEDDPDRRRGPRGAIPAALISDRDGRIRSATPPSRRPRARYELLAQGLASEHDQILASHRQAVQMLASHLEDSAHLTGPGVAPLLARTRAIYPAFEAIAILDPPGRVVASDPPTTASGATTGHRPVRPDWFRRVVAAAADLAVPPDVEVEPDPDERSRVAYRRADRGRSGGLRGVVAAWLRLTPSRRSPTGSASAGRDTRR